MPTASSKFPSSVSLRSMFAAAITFNLFVAYAFSDLSTPHGLEGERGIGQRGLKSFKEKATGTNITFDCSPSGPCVPCLYAEKKDENYRCSETGYRIPMKCAKSASPVDEEKQKGEGRGTLEVENNGDVSGWRRNLLEEDSSSSMEAYVTYRSCIPAVDEEKLSVLGFEALMLLLLVGSSFAIFKRKGSLIMMPGAVRVPTTTRF